MPVPPDPILAAAARWLELLSRSNKSRAQALLHTSTRYSDLTPTQYATAYEWLLGVGAIEGDSRHAERVPARSAVFEAAIVDTLWFPNADFLVRHSAELPEDAIRLAAALELDLDIALASVRSAWGKVDTARREEVGLAGEL